jgi:hypothetical protein
MSELLIPVPVLKPNKTYIMRTIGECLSLGMSNISLVYKDQNIDLKWIHPDKCYIGLGSINEFTGESIAKELNTIYKGMKQAAQFINEHFHYIKGV